MPSKQMYFTIQDAKGEQSTILIDFPFSGSTSDIILTGTPLASAINALVNGGLVNAGFRMELDLSGAFPAAAALDSDVQEKAFFAFRSVGNFLKTLTLPTILESMFIPGTKFLDTSAAPVGVFLTLMTDGIDVSGLGGTGIVQPSTMHGEDLIDIASPPREAWGKYRR